MGGDRGIVVDGDGEVAAGGAGEGGSQVDVEGVDGCRDRGLAARGVADHGERACAGERAEDVDVGEGVVGVVDYVVGVVVGDCQYLY